MKDRERQNAKTIADRAQELGSAIERSAYLSEACAGDAVLLSQVEGLLQGHDGAGDSSGLGALAIAETMDVELGSSSIAEGPGSRIGPYKLLQKLGEGGMGVVYMAEQEQPVRRRVALKIIKPGMDSAQVIARFEAERQALALMDHQNIARVHDAGATATGRPYFVMELVHGVPVTTYCDENRLSPRERLELFVPICHAVQHAHQKGIIHRDLKPSNLLVTLYDGKPVPKVIDFGVAKATEQKLTERTMFTLYGTIVGTLEYMAPEQAEMSALGIDTRSDVYSLGVVLYELLTGSTPLEARRLREAALTDVLRLIKEEEPPRPSLRLTTSRAALATISARRGTDPVKLTKLVRGELDWIVMRCLEKDRTRRYETADGLARDIERYLADEPVEACPPSALYRLRKLAHRYRGSLWAAGVVITFLIGAVVVSSWLAVRARRAELAARSEQVNTAAALDFIEKELLAPASPSNEPDRDIKLRTVVDRAASRLETLAGKPLVDASIRRMVGRLYSDLGELPESLLLLERAYQVHLETLGERHVETIRTLFELEKVVWQMADYDRAAALGARAITLSREVLGEADPLTFELQRLMARTYAFVGQCQKGVAILEPALEVSRRAFGDANENTLAIMNDLGVCLRVPDPMRAEAILAEVLKRRTHLLGEKNPSTLITAARLSITYGRLGRYAEEERLAEQTLRLREEVLGKKHQMTLQSVTTLAHAYLSQRKDAAAQDLVLQLLELSAEPGFADSPFHLIGMRHLASTYQARGDWAASERLYAVLVEKVITGHGGRFLRRDRLLAGLGESLLRQGKHGEAEPHLAACVEYRRQALPEMRCRFEAMSLLGKSLAGQGKRAEAEPLLLDGFAGMKRLEDEVLEEDPDEDDRRLSLTEAATWIAELYEDAGKQDDAAAWRRTIETTGRSNAKP